MALSDCSLPAWALPPSFPCFLHFGRAQPFPALTSSLARKGGGGKAPETKTHARPLRSRLRAAGRASAVCACAFKHCGLNSFRVCPQLDLLSFGAEGQT